MGGLKPDTVIASGASQSAMRLGSYINAAHRSSRVFDGFYLIVHWGICPPIEEIPLMGLFAPTDNDLSPAMCQIRDDLNVPILSLATECEARYNFPVRQAETSSFRFWEIAGASHGSPARNDLMAQIMKRDGVSYPRRQRIEMQLSGVILIRLPQEPWLIGSERVKSRSAFLKSP